MRAHGVNLPCALPLLADGDAPRGGRAGADVVADHGHHCGHHFSLKPTGGLTGSGVACC